MNSHRVVVCELLVLIISVALMSVFCRPSQAQGPVDTIWSGVFTSAQASQGEVEYSANCSACHGGDLQGIDTAPALVDQAFFNDWSGRSLDDLTMRISTTMPVNRPSSLGRATVMRITAYILSLNGFPPGARLLDSDRGVLKSIIITQKH